MYAADVHAIIMRVLTCSDQSCKSSIDVASGVVGSAHEICHKIAFANYPITGWFSRLLISYFLLILVAVICISPMIDELLCCWYYPENVIATPSVFI